MLFQTETPEEPSEKREATINFSRPDMPPAIAKAMKADKGSFTRSLDA